jgi:hypothetical protein
MLRWIVILCLVGCGGSPAPSDSGLRLDSGSEIDSGSSDFDAGVTGTDAGMTGTDAGMTGTDAGMTGTDAGMTDAGASSCPDPIEDRMAGQCDGRGQMICDMWAQMYGGSTADAHCINQRCARADTCDDTGTCTCGASPECADDQMCVSGVAGYSCVCILPP